MAGSRRIGETLVKLQPRLLRHGELAWRPLRRFKPVLRVKHLVILTRHEDVRMVLERDDAFSVTYAEKMHDVTGPFILGMDDGEQYRRESGALRKAAPGADLPRVAELTRARARTLLEEPAQDGKRRPLDAVDLADQVVGAGLDAYFGLPRCAGPRARDGARDVFRAVFFDGDVPAVMQRGEDSAQELTAAIRAAMADGPDGDTVLGRLLAATDEGPPLMDAEAIPRSLLGLVAAWAASVPRAFALGLDVLLDRPAELERISRSAADGDEATVATLLIEALRLQPQAPFLTRLARKEVVVAPGSTREHRIHQGDIVFAVTQSAQRDRHVLDGPGALRTDRPRTDVLHFGAGLHTCFGAAISRAQFGALGTALLAGGDIRRAGPLTWDGAFPAALPLTRA